MMIDSHYLVHSVYGPQVQPFRLALSQHPVWRFLDRPDPVILELFLIQYCALGSAMTEPVEGWLRRAGERCHELGWPEVGAFFTSQANREKEHHLPFLHDTRWLVERWNKKHDRQLNVDRLLSQSLPGSVLAYRALHEATISGDAPYCILAIEFEIDRLSLIYGAAAIPKIVKARGPRTINGFRFLEGRVKEGSWHTPLNEAQLNQVLHNIPSAVTVLTETAVRALKAYGEYLKHCLTAATNEAAAMKHQDPSSPPTNLARAED